MRREKIEVEFDSIQFDRMLRKLREQVKPEPPGFWTGFFVAAGAVCGVAAGLLFLALLASELVSDETFMRAIEGIDISNVIKAGAGR